MNKQYEELLIICTFYLIYISRTDLFILIIFENNLYRIKVHLEKIEIFYE